MTKYACLALIGMTASFGLLHHVVAGPNKVTEHDEEEGARMTGGTSA